MNIEIEPIGTKEFYEHYHNQYIWGETIIAVSHYDSKQEFHICDFRGLNFKKRLYARTPEGIRNKLLKLYESNPSNS